MRDLQERKIYIIYSIHKKRLLAFFRWHCSVELANMIMDVNNPVSTPFLVIQTDAGFDSSLSARPPAPNYTHYQTNITAIIVLNVGMQLILHSLCYGQE